MTGPVGYGDNNGPIPADYKWAIEYTTDPITGDRVADNKKLKFTKKVDDYSKVTAVRFVLEAPMPLMSGYGGTEGFGLQKLNFPLVTHDEITPTSVAYYRTSLVDSEHSYDSDFVALAGPNFVDHDKVLANSKGSVRQLFKEEGTNKELAPQTDTGMKPVGEALSLTHPKTIQFEGKPTNSFVKTRWIQRKFQMLSVKPSPTSIAKYNQKETWFRNSSTKPVKKSKHLQILE